MQLLSNPSIDMSSYSCTPVPSLILFSDRIYISLTFTYCTPLTVLGLLQEEAKEMHGSGGRSTTEDSHSTSMLKVTRLGLSHYMNHFLVALCKSRHIISTHLIISICPPHSCEANGSIFHRRWYWK